MPDEIDEAQWFSAVLDGEVSPVHGDNDLLLLADEIRTGLGAPQLNAAARNRILVAATRLADGTAADRTPLRRMRDHVHVHRKAGIALGGAALVGVGAALGYAVIHGRQQRRGLSLVRAGA